MTSLGTLVLIEQACQNLKTLFVAYNLHSFYVASFRNPLALSKVGLLFIHLSDDYRGDSFAQKFQPQPHCPPWSRTPREWSSGTPGV